MNQSANPERRFIEESFPVKEVGQASAREKSIRHGHISTLHIWWARRPLAASRATAYAALTPAPQDAEEWQRKRDFIIQLCQWENSNNQALLEKARQDILDANDGVPPKVLDPFAGGGSYPLEALRLGCEAYANDYNPVAVLIEKATLEYPQKFGRPFEGMPEWARPQKAMAKDKDQQPSLFSETPEREDENFNPLLEGVRYWGNWVLEQARKELAQFYPPDPDGSIPVGYIWARTIPCQNPVCGQEIPLMRSFWLHKKEKKKVAFYPNLGDKKLKFQIVGDGYEEWPKGFDPDNGLVTHAVATCPLCGGVVDDSTIRQLFQEGKAGQCIVGVVLANNRGEGKHYRVATPADEQTYLNTESFITQKRTQFLLEWGMESVPDEPISKERPSPNARGTSGVTRYGFNVWGSLFNSRQQLALITFASIIRSLDEYSDQAVSSEFNQAVSLYLSFAFDRMATYVCSFTRWRADALSFERAFDRQALPMIWDYGEVSPLSTSRGGWNVDSICETIAHLAQSSQIPGRVYNLSANRMSFPDNCFDAIFTDPPYYDNIPYSHLSDFFYVWLKRLLGHKYPEIFSTPLTPKAGEIVAYTLENGGFAAGKQFFEDNLRLSFQEMNRVLKPNGIAVIVYAHKSTEGWETVINALLGSGLIMASAWPLNTEMRSRLVASETAALASSIYIVARKMPRQPTGFYNDVRAELRQHLDAKLQRLWEEGISGADFFIAAIGSAIEVFGKYEQVMDYEGEIVRADRLLEEVRGIATDYAVRQILHNGFASEITGLERLYVLWRWNYGEAQVPFDEGRKLAQSCGVDLAQEWGGKGGFVKKEKEFIRLLGPQQRRLEDLEEPKTMIDALHKALLLWEKSRRAEMVQALAQRGYGRSEAFYRVAQAISETLPNESKEKKLLDGFLAGRERVQEEVGKVGEQGRLWE